MISPNWKVAVCVIFMVFHPMVDGFWWGRRKPPPKPSVPPRFTHCRPPWTESVDDTPVVVRWMEPTARANRPMSYETSYKCSDSSRGRHHARYECNGEMMDYEDYRYYWPFCLDKRCVQQSVPVYEITPTRLGPPPGSRFTEGRHSITYTARDSDGLTATCVVTFTVNVVRCPTIGTAPHRSVSCTNSNKANSRCTVSCTSGYYVNGLQSPVVCQRSGVWTSKFPTCSELLLASGDYSGDYDV